MQTVLAPFLHINKIRFYEDVEHFGLSDRIIFEFFITINCQLTN